MSASKESADEEKLNSVAVEIRVLETTFNELTSRQNLLERALLENRAALETVKGLSDQEPGEVLLQIGGGALVRSTPPSVDTVLVNVGANIVVEKKKEEAVAMLEERVREIEKSAMSILEQRNQIAERLEADRQLLESILARSGQKG